MSLDLYNKDLLRLAASATGAGRLEQPEGTGEVVNPVCGDRITIDVETDAGGIARIGYDVHACVLTQASASLLGRLAQGASEDEIRTLAATVEAMLAGDAPATPALTATGYAVFEPVRAHKSRHQCVMLPLRALLRALGARAPQDLES